MIREEDTILLGTLARTHGKQGDLQLNFKDDFLNDAEEVNFLFLLLDGILTPFRLSDWRDKGAESYIVTLEGIDTEEKAAAVCGTQVYMLRSDLSEHPEADILTMDDLIGFEVVDSVAGRVGTIVEVDESTQNTLFLLDNEVVIPAHDDFVDDIDYAHKLLHVTLPAGLLEV